jgi:hypothetical protein
MHRSSLQQTGTRLAGPYPLRRRSSMLDLISLDSH